MKKAVSTLGCLAFGFVLLSTPVRAEQPTQPNSASEPVVITIRIPKDEISNSGHQSYVLQLLCQALERSKAKNEAIQLLPVDEYFTQARLMAELQKGTNIDLIWTMTTKEREISMQPIRVPILKGLLGQRVFLIRQDQQESFSKINHLSELSKLVAGQGSHWPDTDILRENGLTVLTSTHYELLFNMLKGGRFHYFPRGLNEAWAEVEAHTVDGLMVEQHLLLSYPAPMYFFVHNDNVELAKRLETGLAKMINDGSFDRLFNSHPSIAGIVERAQLDRRKIFTLTNSSLPSETPLSDPRYWLQIQ